MNESALRISLKIIKMFEGCNLISYPDPTSDLYKALSNNNMLQKYMRGAIKHSDLPEHFQVLSGKPWTIGWGETKDITHSMQWTQEEADSIFAERVQEFMAGVLKASPKLAKAPPQRLAAVVSLAYNIGLTAYAKSTVARCIAKDDHENAAKAFEMWNKAGGKVMQGLVNRRKLESDLYKSVGV